MKLNKKTPRTGGVEKKDKPCLSSSSVGQESVRSSSNAASSVNTPVAVTPWQWYRDSVALIAVCRAHWRMAISPLHGHPFRATNLWFPVRMLPFGKKSLKQAIRQLLEQLVPASSMDFFTEPKLVHTLSFQLNKGADVTRNLFSVESKEGNCVCSHVHTEQSNASARVPAIWLDLADILKKENLPGNLHGPEPAIVAAFLLKEPNKSAGFPAGTARLWEISAGKLRNAVTTGPASKLFRPLKCSPDDLQQLFRGYIQNTYPSPYMMEHSLREYLSRVAPNIVTNEEVPSLLNAFKLSPGPPYIDFYEFAAGLAAIDPRTPHVGENGKTRTEYIFRYFKKIHEKALSFQELSNIVGELHKRRDATIPGDKECLPDSIDSTLQLLYQRFGLSFGESVSLEIFCKVAEMREFAGFANIFRVKVSLLTHLRSQQLIKSGSRLSCGQCRLKKHRLAAHSVTFSPDGFFLEATSLETVPSVQRLAKSLRTLSDTMFDKTNLANVMLEHVRNIFKRPQFSNFKSPRLRQLLLKDIFKLIEQMKEIAIATKRIVSVSSPVIVFGDLHGNLSDLLAYERIFWRMGPACATSNYLFLGDYVDRGEYSIEVVIYLIACKILAPDRFHILRGNHEVMAINNVFTFLQECKRKFGDSGVLICKQFNDLFDHFPLAAVIDGKIFTAHGGIPATELNVKVLLESIPCPMKNPSADYPPAWEILWNDPVSASEYERQLAELREQNCQSILERLPIGYVQNIKRATAFYYSPLAVDNFLNENGLSHVIRAHEVIPHGFCFHSGGRVITVFSSSNYCNINNDAAVMLVVDNKIRPIKVETH